MKKVIAILIIAVLALSLFSCKRGGELDEGVAELPAQQQQPESEPTPESEVVDNTKETEALTEGTQDKTQVKAGDGDGQTTGSSSTVEEPDFTTDVPFSEYEVVVTLTDEETAKGKTYTTADFPELDVFNVFKQKHYSSQGFPEYYKKTTLILMMNEPSRERVLEYIKILKKDPRVFDAEPNADTIARTGIEADYIGEAFNYRYIVITLTDEASPGLYDFEPKYTGQTWLTPEDFPGVKLTRILSWDDTHWFGTYHSDGSITVIGELEDRTEEGVMTALKTLVKDPRVKTVEPNYAYINECSVIVYTNSKDNNLQIGDIDEQNIAKITELDIGEHGKAFTIIITNPGKFNILKFVEKLKTNPKYAGCSYSYWNVQLN